MGGLLALIGGKPMDDEESPKDMACKALFKAIKKDDYESFKTALDDYMSYSSESGGDKEDEEDEGGKPDRYATGGKRSSLFDD